MTVWDAVGEALSGWGSADCLLELHSGSGLIHTSARQLQREVLDFACQLSAWGIRRRHLVPLFLNNSVDFVRAFLAMLKIGAVPLLVKMDYRHFELAEVFRNAEPQAVLAEKQHLPILQPFLNDRQIVIERSTDGFRLVQSAECLPPREDIPEPIASINYTYRGYGYPLGAMVSHAQYLHGARVLQDGLQARAGEKMLVILPMAHIFTLIACIFVPLLYGLTGALALTLNPRLLWNFIRDSQIDHITSVPEVYQMLYRQRDPSIALSSLKAFVSGGSHLSNENYELIKSAFSIDLLHGYGLTEFTPISRNMRGQARPGTIGPICDGLECRIASPQLNGAGEIQIRGKNIAEKYYRRPRESAEVFLEGWFRTGDLGRLDGGHLLFLKELKKTRKINGNIVDLLEVSRALKEDPEITEVEVCLEEGVLVARIAIPAAIDFREKSRNLKASLRGILAEYKIPRRIIHI
jgi:long-chain acyl-CoA synthetase